MQEALGSIPGKRKKKGKDKRVFNIMVNISRALRRYFHGKLKRLAGLQDYWMCTPFRALIFTFIKTL
jgi:hypothetical protein